MIKKIIFAFFVLAVLVGIYSVLGITLFEKQSFQNIIEDHTKRYPEMQVDDMFKLIFHASMGNKHLLNDIEKAREYLKKELESVQASPGELVEKISPDENWIRINLAAFKAKKYNPDDLFEVMVLSAKQGNESLEDFKRYVEDLFSLQKQGVVKYSQEAIRKRLDQFMSDTKQPIYHSEKYLKAYRPSYRVVLSRLFYEKFGQILPFSSQKK